MSAFSPLSRLTEFRRTPIRGKGLVASYSAHRLHLREKKTKADPRMGSWWIREEAGAAMAWSLKVVGSLSN